MRHSELASRSMLDVLPAFSALPKDFRLSKGCSTVVRILAIMLMRIKVVEESVHACRSWPPLARLAELGMFESVTVSDSVAGNLRAGATTVGYASEANR